MIGCLVLARETFDIEYAKKKIKETKNIINKLNKGIKFFDDLIVDDKIGKEALKFFENNKCTTFIVIQSTFTDAKFISSFVKKFKKPILFISLKEKRTGGRLRLNSLCGVNLGLHSLIKNKFYSNFVIYSNDEKSFSKEVLKIIKNKNHFTKKKYLKSTVISKKSNKKLIEFKKPNLGLIGERPEGFDTCDFNTKELKTEKLLELCNHVNTTTYISGISGKDYLDEKLFSNSGIKVVYENFIHPIYNQFHGEFIEHMSIIDLLFNVGENSSKILSDCKNIS